MKKKVMLGTTRLCFSLLSLFIIGEITFCFFAYNKTIFRSRISMYLINNLRKNSMRNSVINLQSVFIQNEEFSKNFSAIIIIHVSLFEIFEILLSASFRSFNGFQIIQLKETSFLIWLEDLQLELCIFHKVISSFLVSHGHWCE